MIGLIYSRAGSHYIDALKAFGKMGEESIFFEEDYRVTDQLKKCDWYVLVGNDVKNKAAKEYVYKSGKPFLVITSAFFNGKTSRKYVRVHVNGFTNNFASMPPSDIDRWQKIRDHNKLPEVFKKQQGSKIVIALNAMTSPAKFDIDMEDWLYNTCRQIRKVTDEEIWVRSHRKKLIGFGSRYKEAKREFRFKTQTDTKETKLQDCSVKCAITLTTTYSVGSLALGVPNIVTHPGNFVYGVARSEITKENLSWYPDHDQLVQHYGMLANCEWTLEEIENGTAMKVLRPLLEENKIINREWLGSEFKL